MEKRTLRIQCSNGENALSYLTIAEPKEQVSKAEAETFVQYLADNGLVIYKGSALKSMVKATLITRTEREL